MSGLSHTPGKRARGQTLRGFESRLLRQRISKHGPSGLFLRLTPSIALSILDAVNWHQKWHMTKKTTGRTIDGIEVEMGSGNVFADLGLPDADKLRIKSGLVIEITRAMGRANEPAQGNQLRDRVTCGVW